MNSVVVNGTIRETLGKKATKAVRKAGLVPCVIYGGKENVHFTAESIAFRDLIYTPDFNLAEINIDGKAHKCIIKSTTFHPVTDGLQHIDFLLLNADRKFKVDLPVRFTGEAPGVKEGGTIVQKLRRISVKTTLDALTDVLTADISGLDLGSSVRVRDIDLPEGMEIMNPMANPIASVEVPRALKSAEAEEEGEEGEEGGGEAATTTGENAAE